MSKPKIDFLTVFPGRKNPKIADESELRTAKRVTRQSSGGSLYTICEYTGERIAYKTASAARKRVTVGVGRVVGLRKKHFEYSPETSSPKRKVAKQEKTSTRSVRPRKAPTARSPPLETTAAPAEHARAPTPPIFKSPENIPVTPQPPISSSFVSERGDTSSDGFLDGDLSGDLISNFNEALFDLVDDTVTEENDDETVKIRGMYSKEDATPVTFLGKLAIEYDNFDFTTVCDRITNLACFHKSHEESLIPLLKLVDRDVTKKLTTVNIKNFYKHELIPAMENLKVFQEEPDKFHDSNKGQFELYIEEDYIVEVPLPPRPQIFPYQMRNRELASIAEKHSQESEKRFLEEEARIQEEERRQAEHRRAQYELMIRETEERRRLRLEQLQQHYRNQVPFVNPFLYQDVNNNITFQHLYFPQVAQNPPPQNYYGHIFNHQMYP